VSERFKPRNAATVILLRTRAAGEFEVFMTRRPAGMNFLGGMYVFPGGSVRKEDYCEAIRQRCYGLSPKEAQKILGMHLSPEISLGHWVAGIRELFEEVGVLLCVTEDGTPVDLGQVEVRERLAGQRKSLIEKSIDFLAILKSERLLCNAAGLAYFSHWQTPEESAIRFDTRFYLALLPANQRPLSTSEEVTHSLWLTPDRAVKLCQEGALPVIMPTFSSLRTLADFDSLESLFAEYRSR